MKRENKIFNSYENDLNSINDIATKDDELLKTYDEEDLDEENTKELENSADEIIDLDNENENKLSFEDEKQPRKYKRRLFKKENLKRDNIIVDDNISEENYDDDSSNLDDEDNENDDIKKKPNMVRIFNVVFIIITILVIMIGIDYVCVSNFSAGPFFAIPVHTYKDGGSKEYLGLGYKVIKYNQIQGRRDKVIGPWSLKYNTTPIDIESIDLAIEFNTNEEKSYKKYNKKFLRIESTLEGIDKENNIINVGYIDEGKKYSLNIICDIADKNIISKLKGQEKITVIGTVTGYDYESPKQVGTLYLSNCFAEQ